MGLNFIRCCRLATSRCVELGISVGNFRIEQTLGNIDSRIH